MRYKSIEKAVFLNRPNRFIARVLLNEREMVCHVKNTGRCRELLVPGAEVWLEGSDNPNRKTAWDLVAVEKAGKLINMDAQAPNWVFGEWAVRQRGVLAVHPEVTFGKSRLDFALETERGLHLVEVKGVTLEEGGHTRFPDAPTERGVKHLQELMGAVEQGYEATAFFVIQMEDAVDFSPNESTHPAFGQTLRQAAAQGVHVVAYTCHVTPEEMTIYRPVPVLL